MKYPFCTACGTLDIKMSVYWTLKILLRLNAKRLEAWGLQVIMIFSSREAQQTFWDQAGLDDIEW